MSKPLSETHQTLYARFIETNWINPDEEWDVNYEDLLREVQSCTVDVAEHEALKKQLFEAVNNYGNLQAEVERVKEDARQEWFKGHNEAWRLANVEIELLKKDHGALWSDRIKMMEDVERLKNEVECMKMESTAYDVGFLNGERRGFELAKQGALDSCLETCKYDEGFKEGERRAMERVKEVLDLLCERYADRSAPDSLNDLKRAMWKLGLGEEKKR